MSAARENVEAGARLGGRYRVVHPIARGGMGAVYEAVDERIGRRVAVKVLLDELAHDPTCAERFRREARAVSAITHRGLVALYDLSLETRPAFLVMELVDGEPLGARIASEGRIPWARAAHLASEVLDALASLHGAGIVHRDLKPSNVLVTESGGVEHARVIDLGVAQLTSGEAYQRLTETGAVVGTPAYMAPEQLEGRRATPAVDLWAAGALLYQALTGQRPFEGAHVAQLLLAIREREPPSLARLVPDAPPALVALVAELLAKDPARRPPSASAASARLREITSTATPSSLRAPLRATSGMHSGVVAPMPSAPTPVTVAAPATALGPRTIAVLASSRWSQLAALVALVGVLATCMVGIGLGALFVSQSREGGAPLGPVAMPMDDGRAHDVSIGYRGAGSDGVAAAMSATIDGPLRACIPDPGAWRVATVYSIWFRPGGGTPTRIHAEQTGATPAEQACFEGVLRAASWPAPIAHPDAPSTLVVLTPLY